MYNSYKAVSKQKGGIKNMNNFGAMFDQEIVQKIHTLVSESSKLKNEIFKTITMNKELDRFVVKYYLSFINEFLKFWDEYASDLGEKIKSTNPTEGIRTLDYHFVKEYVYANYDYASILKFTDQIMKDVETKKFSKPSEIENFFVHSIKTAFNNQPESVAELLDSVLEDGIHLDNNKLVTKVESQLFNSIRRYNKLFDHRVRGTLYKSIDKVLEYITRELPSIKMSLDFQVIRLFVSIVNNVVEYITYSLTAFATRIYIISRYAYPFINSYIDSPRFIKESVDSSYGENLVLLRDVEDLVVKDPAKLKDFCEIFDKFLISIGSNDFGSNKPTYTSHIIGSKGIQNNSFCSKLLANPLFQLLTNDPFSMISYSKADASINELHQLLKTHLYNDKHGMEGFNTPKQEILHVIRGEEPKDTLDGYKENAKDLYLFMLHLCCSMKSFIEELNRWINQEQIENLHSISTLNRTTECIHMLTELYRDIVSAILSKARHLEMKINELQKNQVDKIIADVSISIPGQKKSDVSLNDNMMCSVPDTTRMPMNLIDIYGTPHYEKMHIYNECLKLLPEFSSDFYLTEGTIANIIDKLKALLQGAQKKVVVFFNNASTQAAFKWVKDHEKDLLNIQFSSDDKIDQCYPLKQEIGLPAGYNNLLKGLENFNEDHIKDETSLQKFIQSLYPNPTIYQWFTNERFMHNGKQMGPQMYRNLILFQDMNNVSMNPLKPVTFQGEHLKQQFQGWVETVKSGNEVYKSYLELDKKISDAIDKIKSKIISITNKENQQTSDNEKNKNAQDESIESPSNDQISESTKGAGPTVTTGDTKVDNTNNSLSDSAITEITKVMNHIWIPLGDMICQAIKQEYKYMKMVYKAKKQEDQKS